MQESSIGDIPYTITNDLPDTPTIQITSIEFEDVTYADTGILLGDIIIEITGVDSAGAGKTERVFDGGSSSPINTTHNLLDMFASSSDNEIIITINTINNYDDESYGVFNSGRLLINIDCVYGDDGDDGVGVCCIGNSCNIWTGADCAAFGGTYMGDGTTCEGDPPPCGTPDGGT